MHCTDQQTATTDDVKDLPLQPKNPGKTSNSPKADPQQRLTHALFNPVKSLHGAQALHYRSVGLSLLRDC